ncbi:amphi-Trp domain-containing protein [bacterium endosymbiont of Escarpia laminata]|nr:MAG: amphi-Trp domain-containing protein [bacterium endosymbiont of Escarpia laminata]
MRTDGKSFRHESLQDTKAIRDLLKSISQGLKEGHLSFSDADGEIVMEPEGLLQFKLTATKRQGRHRINMRISWQVDEPSEKKDKSLSVRSRR